MANGFLKPELLDEEIMGRLGVAVPQTPPQHPARRLGGVVAGVSGVFLVALLILFLRSAAQEHFLLAGLTVVLVMLLLACFMVGASLILSTSLRSTAQWAQKRSLRRFSSDHLTRLAEGGNLPGMEAAYCRVVARLARDTSDLGSRDSLLRQLRELLEKSRALVRLDAELEGSLREAAPHRLRREAEALAARLEAVTDMQARRSLEEALRLSGTRLDNALAMETMAERVTAQLEMIRQALASVESTLLRRELVQGEQGKWGSGLGSVTELVVQINRQTRELENALAEVAALH